MYINRAKLPFRILNTTLCVLAGLICLLPLIHVLALSFSDKSAIMAGEVSLWPVKFTLDNFRYVAGDREFYAAFFVSVKRCLLAWVVQMSATLLAAYPLAHSKRSFHGRSIYAWILMIAMIFNGGLIPTYLVVAKTGLVDSIWSLVLPGAVPIFYVMLMQNFMKALPQEIEESAFVDGAGYFRTFIFIILPLCKVSIAAISLFIIVDNWNAWYDGMVYINSNAKWPLQTYLRTIIVSTNIEQMQDLESLARLVATNGADSAKIILSLLPILVVYPFLQKYFVTGVVLGGVKE